MKKPSGEWSNHDYDWVNTQSIKCLGEEVIIMNLMKGVIDMKKLIAIICMITGLLASLILMAPAFAANWVYVARYPTLPDRHPHTIQVYLYLNMDAVHSYMVGKNSVRTVNMKMIEMTPPDAPIMEEYDSYLWNLFIDCTYPSISATPVSTNDSTAEFPVPVKSKLGRASMKLCKH